MRDGRGDGRCSKTWAPERWDTPGSILAGVSRVKAPAGACCRSRCDLPSRTAEPRLSFSGQWKRAALNPRCSTSGCRPWGTGTRCGRLSAAASSGQRRSRQGTQIVGETGGVRPAVEAGAGSEGRKQKGKERPQSQSPSSRSTASHCVSAPSARRLLLPDIVFVFAPPSSADTGRSVYCTTYRRRRRRRPLSARLDTPCHRNEPPKEKERDLL